MKVTKKTLRGLVGQQVVIQLGAPDLGKELRGRLVRFNGRYAEVEYEWDGQQLLGCFEGLDFLDIQAA